MVPFARRDRELQEKERAVNQIEMLKQSLADAKAQRRKLMDELKQESKASRDKSKDHEMEVRKLKKECTTQTLAARKAREEVSAKKAVLERMHQENQKLKDKINKMNNDRRKEERRRLAKIQSGQVRRGGWVAVGPSCAQHACLGCSTRV